MGAGAPRALEFWFSIGSTYTYLSVMRIAALAERAGVSVVWRPFSVRTLMVEQGNIPFRDKPIKAAYMWRDIERRAGRHGLAIRVPAPYPLAQWDLVNRVAVLASQEGWCEPYVQETYRRWFVLGQEPGVGVGFSETLASVGQDPDRVVAAASAPGVEAAYLAATDEARGRGLFGSPSFLVDDELFWGDDRLEDALAWARRTSTP
jgi:2-hydroxychromene-2-carboxylate isomerase